MRPAAVVTLEVKARKVDLQINGFRHQSKTALNDGDGLVEPSGLGKLTGEFLEGRHKWRAPRRGAPQMFNRFGAASGAAQRRPKQHFDTRIAAAACCLFERCNRLLATVLSNQGPSQDRHRDDVGPAHSQDLSGELLGLSEVPHPQREAGAFKHLRAGMVLSATDRWERMLRHGACIQICLAANTIAAEGGAKQNPRQFPAGGSLRVSSDELNYQLR